MASPSVDIEIPIFRFDSGARLRVTRAYVEQLAATPSECEVGAVEQAIGRFDYQDAYARVLARSVNGSTISAELMAALFPWCRPADSVCLVALADGERGTRLVESSERGRFPHDFDGAALHALALRAAWMLDGEKLRTRITKELHRLHARYKAPRGYYSSAIAGELARSMGEDSIAHDYDVVLPQAVIDLQAALMTTRASVLETILKELERADPQRPVGRQQIVRVATKIGRNEPCPCGSGQKYKRCHGSSGHDVPLTPLTLTTDDIMAMPYERICMLSPEALADAPLQALVSRFLDALAGPRAEQALEVLARRPEVPRVRLDRYRVQLVAAATSSLRHDVVQRHIDKIEPANAERFGLSPIPGLVLALRLRSPDVGQHLLAAADDAIKDDTGRRAQILAAHLLAAAPALGILMGRGCLLAEESVAEILLRLTSEARVELGLPPDDPAVRIHAGLQHEREAREAREDAERLRAVLQETTRRVRELEQRGRDLEQRGRELEARLRERDAALVEREASGAADPIDARTLREKIETLQARIREGNEERAMLRRQLAATDATVDDGERVQNGGGVAAGPGDEEEEAAPADAVPRRVVAPFWSRAAEDGLRAVPTHVAAAALRTVADLAGGDVAAWRAVKRPAQIDRPILMARIGIHHRLIFDVEGDKLGVLELIPRSSLDLVVKRLRAT